MERYLQEKRDELIFALTYQGYTGAQVARLFGIDRSTVHRILKDMPDDYKPKWKKVEST